MWIIIDKEKLLNLDNGHTIQATSTPKVGIVNYIIPDVNYTPVLIARYDGDDAPEKGIKLIGKLANLLEATALWLIIG